MPQTTNTGPTLSLSLAVENEGLFLPGDEVRLAILPSKLDQLQTDSFTLAVKLPDGLLLTDNFWWQQENIAYRKLPKPANQQAFLIDLTTRIATGFKGYKLTINAYFFDTPDQQKTLAISVATLLSSQIDTCLSVQDSSLNIINTFLATRQQLTARLKAPINLSPTAPLRISHGNCKAFIFKPGKKKDKQKENCTALHFAFVGSEGEDYPMRFTPGPEKLKGITNFISNSRKGDTINISVKTLDGKPLRGIILAYTKGGEIIEAAMEAAQLSYETVLDAARLDLTLHLRARRGFLNIFNIKQYCLVEVIRRPTSVTMLRGAGAPPQQPDGDSEVLTRDVSSVANGDTTWNETAVQHLKNSTIFYRIQETGKGEDVRRDTISQDTCPGHLNIRRTGKSTARSIWVPADTLLFQAAEEERTIVGTRNPMGIQQGNIEIKVPLELNIGDPDTQDTLVGIVYWIGIGEPPLAEYAALAEEVPPEWAQPGVSAPLAAYGLSHPVVLPGLITSEKRFQKQNVRYDFVSHRGRAAFAKGGGTPLIRRDDNRPNFGLINGDELKALGKTIVYDLESGKDVLRFHLAYANVHEINSYRLQLKIVAFYQLSVPGIIWDPATP